MPTHSSVELPLHPHIRKVYGRSLRPPARTVFDGGIAATFSLDFETALAIPATLALYAAENVEDLLRNPMALLEGIERTSQRMAIFCQAGRVHAGPRSESRLCALLERLVVEARAPGGGEFHPKLWALRYRPVDPDASIRLRVLVLSRNLTRDRSWDLCLCVDGEPGTVEQSANRPLKSFIRALPKYAVVAPPDHVVSLSEKLANDIGRARWRIPSPFRSLSFTVLGSGERRWQPQRCSQLGVVSPFCSAGTLEMLANLVAQQQAHLVSSTEELDRIPQKVLDRFGSVSVMHEYAETEEGEDIEDPVAAGLHAKVFVQQVGKSTALTMGSANATAAALQDGRNVEVQVTLAGRTKEVGSVAEILGPEGLGQVLVRYGPRRGTVDPERDEAEARLEEARREIVDAGLKLHCSSQSSKVNGNTLWRMTLESENELHLSGIGSVDVWPVTRGEGHRRHAIAALKSGISTDLGAMALVDMSRFIAFSLRDRTGKAGVTFALCLRMDGAPEDRDAATLRWLIDSREAFLRYLRLLLAELSDPLSAQTAALQAANGNGAGGQMDYEPILEEMVHALSKHRDRLQTIGRLLRRLERGSESGAADVVPEEFLALWRSFREALEMAQ